MTTITCLIGVAVFGEFATASPPALCTGIAPPMASRTAADTTAVRRRLRASRLPEFGCIIPPILRLKPKRAHFALLYMKAAVSILLSVILGSDRYRAKNRAVF